MGWAEPCQQPGQYQQRGYALAFVELFHNGDPIALLAKM
jgi:hypothetical protein